MVDSVIKRSRRRNPIERQWGDGFEAQERCGVTLRIGQLPEEDGRPIDRLIVCVDGEPVDSVIVGNPMTIDCAIEKLELLAWRLKRRKKQCNSGGVKL